MAGIYVLGALSSLLYMRFMVVISQSTLKEIRDDMFAVMQTLPIKYYDTHTHGDIMSCYTNDTDALMQMVGQSIPSADLLRLSRSSRCSSPCCSPAGS